MYKVWQAMRDRCENPKNRDFKNYGGRGITVCARWQEFSRFLADMGARPQGFDIDREDNDKGYEPGNCRWTSRQNNLNNRRDCNRVEWRGEVKTVAEWSAILDINEETLRYRINKGWPAEKAFTKPVARSEPKPYVYRPRLERRRTNRN